jgi:site-specific recombinase XerD
MDDNRNIPLLLRFYFGDSAANAQNAACQRLKKWSRAFDQWIAMRGRECQKDTVKQTKTAWKRFASKCGKMPWAVRQEDIEKHTAWMEQEGFSATVINCAIHNIASFYQWCADQGVDSACGAGFNPAIGTRKIKVTRFVGSILWTRQEVQSFLDFLQRDETELGKREFAFFMARTGLGVPLKHLVELKWEQLEVEETGVWVKWRAEGEKVKLPDQVWQAMREYLRASGRLEGMRAGKYIFTPQAEPVGTVKGGKAEDWLEERRLAVKTVGVNLKLYGSKLGIDREKLNLMALRRTALRLKMDQGESLEGMRAFMDSQVPKAMMNYRLRKLPELPEGERTDEDHLIGEAELPVRKPYRFKGGDNTIHGFYRRKMDMEAVRAVMAENIPGMEGEISCLHTLMRGLLNCELDAVHLMDVYSITAQRLNQLVSSNDPVEKKKHADEADELLRESNEGLHAYRQDARHSQEIRRRQHWAIQRRWERPPACWQRRWRPVD